MRAQSPPRRDSSLFKPSFCPHYTCSQHLAPEPDFYVRFGSYRAKCRSHRIPRFRCRTCRRTFSRQTFRVDFRDHKPHLNAPLFEMAASGVGIRQCSRNLGLSQRCTELKLRKIGRHLRRLNLNLQGSLDRTARLHFDELETYEGQRNTRPLTVPVLIDTETRFIIWAESAPIRPSGKMTNKRLKAIQAAEKRHGTRRDQSRRSVRRTLQRGADVTRQSACVVLETDEKLTYPGVAKRAFKKQRLVHFKTNSRILRATWNPLFAINNEEAIMRDLMGRLRRGSWLVSKKRRYLDIALHVHIAYRNLVRKRFNRDKESPAQLLGFLPRRLQPTEALSWRQEWKGRSPHPLSSSGASVEAWNRRALVA